MKISHINHYQTINTKSANNTNSRQTNNHMTENISFGALKPKTAKTAFAAVFEKISNFSLKNFINTIKENREISKFKSYLKYEKDFPKNKIAEMFTSKNIEDIRAKRTFYLTAKHDDFLPKGISKEITVDIMSNVNKRNLNLAQNLYADRYFPKEKISSIIQDTDPISFSFKETFYNGLAKRCKLLDEYYIIKNHKDALAFVMEQTDKEYLGFVGQLWNDPAYTKAEVLELLYNNKEETDALKYIYNLAHKKQYDWGTLEQPSIIDGFDARMPSHLSRDAIERTDIIRNLLFYTTKDNVKIAEELCNLTKLNPKIVATALKNTLPTV